MAAISRRELLAVGGVAAGALLLPKDAHPDKHPKAKHVFSLIGEFSPNGAYVSSMVTSRDATAVDLALSMFPDMSERTLVGAQTVDPIDKLVHHDLAGLLAPATQYYARLAIGTTMFGRVLSFRTHVGDADPMNLKIALVSCQRNAVSSDPSQPSWVALQDYGPDLLLHGGDFGYWGKFLSPTDPYTKHVKEYAVQMRGLPVMRSVLEGVSSLIQVSDHETSRDNGDTYNDPITAAALDAYWRLMPYRTFDDPTSRSRFLVRNLGTNVLLIAPDFRSLDRSPGAWVDDESKTAYGEVQLALLTAALKRSEALKIILSDPCAAPADAPASPGDFGTLDKWCNYQTAFQAMADVIRNETTTDGAPINAEIWSGDRHMLGCLSADNNRWGPFDVLTSSGLDQNALVLEAGETYDQVFGNQPETGSGNVKQHMEIELTDDKNGTIARVARGIDDYTGTEVIHSEKSWTYPVGT